MSNMGKMMVMGGAARGLTRGLDDADQRSRLRRQDERLAAQDQRMAGRDARDADLHELRMTQGTMAIEDAETAREHAQFTKSIDAAAAELLMSEGANTAGIEAVYNAQYPDGNQMKIERVDDGRFVLNFGERGQSQPMTADQVIGVTTAMKDPQLYMTERAEREAAERERALKLEDETTKHTRAQELKRLESRLRAGEKDPTYKTDDSGRMWALSRGGMAPVQGPDGVEAPSFKGEATRSGSQSKMLQEIEAIATRLPPVDGETPDQRWLRAAEERARLIGKSDPASAVREYEKAITSQLLNADEVSPTNPTQIVMIKKTIKEMVADFAQRYGEGGAVQDDEDPLGFFSE